MSNQSDQPFQTLGKRLKAFREKLQESLAEVSGAVEVDEEYLHQIEQGTDRPTEDILMLLISHFDMEDDEAAALWRLAGYDYDPKEDGPIPEPEFGMHMPGHHGMMMVVALDQRVMYSDGAEINANKQGLVMTFTQSNGNHVLPISKIGMSYGQAKRVLDILHKTLEEAERRQHPRQLPGPTDKGKTQQK